MGERGERDRERQRGETETESSLLACAQRGGGTLPVFTVAPVAWVVVGGMDARQVSQSGNTVRYCSRGLRWGWRDAGTVCGRSNVASWWIRMTRRAVTCGCGGGRRETDRIHDSRVAKRPENDATRQKATRAVLEAERRAVSES